MKDSARVSRLQQNARTARLVCLGAADPRPRVSAPLSWDELPHVELADFTVGTMPGRYAEKGDLGAAIDGESFSLEALLELSQRQEAAGQADAPWPPHYEKQAGEPARVRPSKRRKR